MPSAPTCSRSGRPTSSSGRIPCSSPTSSVRATRPASPNWSGCSAGRPSRSRSKKSLDAAGLGLDRRRAVIEQLRGGDSDRLLCEALDVHRSSLYHEPRPEEDRPLREALVGLAGEWPTYGYRRLTVMLRRQGHTVNAKRVRRLMGEMGLSGEPPPRRSPDDRQRPRLSPLPEPGRVPGGRAPRSGLGLGHHVHPTEEGVHVSRRSDGCLQPLDPGLEPRAEPGAGVDAVALGRALERGRPEIHHSDQGVQYAATAYVEALTAAGRRSAWRAWANRGRMAMPND